MIFRLHQLPIQLHSSAPSINQQWQDLLQGWIEPKTGEERPFSIHLHFQLAQTLPPLPDSPALFTDHHNWPDGVGVLTVYQVGTMSDTQHPVPGDSHASDSSCLTPYASPYLLHFQDGAWVRVDVGEAQVTGVVLPAALAYGRFQDITFTSLAPLFRQHGYYLVHAFAASKNGRAVLLVGPSGSGKTTAGLALILAGWELLANDMVLLEKRPDGIYALPVPDQVSVRPETLKLLPGLRPIVRALPAGQKLLIPGELLRNGRSIASVPVSAIYFPQVAHQPKTAVYPQNRALALARLMEESIDQWDKPAFPSHLNLLQILSQQTTPYALHLGWDVAHWPMLLEDLP